MLKYSLWVVVMTYTLHAQPGEDEKTFTAQSQPKHRWACEKQLKEWAKRAQRNVTVKHARGECVRHRVK